MEYENDLISFSICFTATLRLLNVTGIPDRKNSQSRCSPLDEYSFPKNDKILSPNKKIIITRGIINPSDNFIDFLIYTNYPCNSLR